MRSKQLSNVDKRSWSLMWEIVRHLMLMCLVFLLAYGVTTLALQHPRRRSSMSDMRIFRDIFYFPYWQIYGELFLEELEGACVCDVKQRW